MAKKTKKVKTNPAPKVNTDTGTVPTCPTGKVWDNVLKQCVLDSGG